MKGWASYRWIAEEDGFCVVRNSRARASASFGSVQLSISNRLCRLQTENIRRCISIFALIKNRIPKNYYLRDVTMFRLLILMRISAKYLRKLMRECYSNESSCAVIKALSTTIIILRNCKIAVWRKLTRLGNLIEFYQCTWITYRACQRVCARIVCMRFILYCCYWRTSFLAFVKVSNIYIYFILNTEDYINSKFGLLSFRKSPCSIIIINQYNHNC